MSRIGERIKETRIKVNMPAKQLAKKCGVSESYILDVESGRKVINESMIKRISSVLNVNIDEPLYKDEEAEEEIIKESRVQAKPMDTKAVNPQWQSAFSNIIKDIPIYKIDMSEIVGYKHMAIIDKKIEGHNPEKIIYIKVPDNTLSSLRIKKDDLVMVLLNHEPLNNGLCLIEHEGKSVIRLTKKLDKERVLLLSNLGEIKADTAHIKDLKVIGHCLKAEINL